MRVSKAQLVNGVMNYVENEVIPQVGDKPTQIIASILVKSIKANNKLVDSVLDNEMVKGLLDQNEDGYEIDGLFDAFRESVIQYGPFPVTIPAIPVVSPVEKTLSFSESDVSEIKRRIERSAANGQ